MKDFRCLRYQRTEYAKQIRKDYETHKIKERRCNMREWAIREDECCNSLTSVQKDNYILEITKECSKSAISGENIGGDYSNEHRE